MCWFGVFSGPAAVQNVSLLLQTRRGSVPRSCRAGKDPPGYPPRGWRTRTGDLGRGGLALTLPGLRCDFGQAPCPLWAPVALYRSGFPGRSDRNDSQGSCWTALGIQRKAELRVSQKPEGLAAEDQAGSLPAPLARGALSVPSHCDHPPAWVRGSTLSAAGHL